jgi:hypothetical protein
LSSDVTTVDQEGIELLDDATARRQAILLAAETLQHAPESVLENRSWRVEVTNANGAPVFTLVVMGVDAKAEVRRPAAVRF